MVAQRFACHPTRAVSGDQARAVRGERRDRRADHFIDREAVLDAGGDGQQADRQDDVERVESRSSVDAHTERDARVEPCRVLRVVAAAWTVGGGGEWARARKVGLAGEARQQIAPLDRDGLLEPPGVLQRKVLVVHVLEDTLRALRELDRRRSIERTRRAQLDRELLRVDRELLELHHLEELALNLELKDDVLAIADALGLQLRGR